MSFTQSSITIASIKRSETMQPKAGPAASQSMTGSQPSANATKSFDQLVLSSFNCPVCKKLLKDPVLLPCIFKVCREHVEPVTSEESGNTSSKGSRKIKCPNPKCAAANREHTLPSKLDDWNVETEETMEALNLLYKRQSLNDAIDEFNASLDRLETLHNEPGDYFERYFATNIQDLRSEMIRLLEYADDFMADTRGIVSRLKSEAQLKFSGIQKPATSSNAEQELDIEITKAKSIIERLNQDRQRTDRLNWVYLNSAFSILENFKARSRQYLRQLESTYVDNLCSEELRLLNSAKGFHDRLSETIRNCEKIVDNQNRSAKNLAAQKTVESKVSPIQTVVANFTEAQSKANGLSLVDKTKAHNLRIVGLCWNPKNRIMYTGSDDHLIKKWKLENGKLSMVGHLKAHGSKLLKMAINTEGTLLASSNDDSVVSLWNLETDTLIHMFRNTLGFEFSSPRSKQSKGYLVTFGENENKKYFITFSSYNTETLQLDFSNSIFICGSRVNCAAFSSNAEYLLTGLQCGNVELFSLIEPSQKPKKLWQRRLSSMNNCFPIKFIKFANNKGEFVVCCDFGMNVLFEFKQGEVKRRMDLADEESSIETLKRKSYMVCLDSACWSCDNKFFIAVNNYIIKVWSTETGKLLHKLTKHMNCIKALIPHPTVPEVIATASYDRRVVVWNVKNGSVLAKFKSKDVSSYEYESFYTGASWLNQNALVTSDLDGTLQYFELVADLRTDQSSPTGSADEASSSTTQTGKPSDSLILLGNQQEASKFTDVIEECNFGEATKNTGFVSETQVVRDTQDVRKRSKSPKQKDTGESGKRIKSF